MPILHCSRFGSLNWLVVYFSRLRVELTTRLHKIYIMNISTKYLNLNTLNLGKVKLENRTEYKISDLGLSYETLKHCLNQNYYKLYLTM